MINTCLKYVSGVSDISIVSVDSVLSLYAGHRRLSSNLCKSLYKPIAFFVQYVLQPVGQYLEMLQIFLGFPYFHQHSGSKEKKSRHY